MPIPAVVILIVGTALAVVTYFTIKTITAPRKITELMKLLQQGKTGAVIKGTKSLIAQDQNNSDAHYLLGQAYIREKKYELALMEYRTVGTIGRFGPACPEREFRRTAAELFERFKQPEEALKEYILLIKMEPENGRFYTKIGQLLEQRDRLDKAEGYYRKALEIDSRIADAHSNLGRLLYNSKRYNEAKKELKIAVTLNPELYHAWLLLGRLAKKSDDFTGALEAFEKAQRDPSQKLKALIERGTCFMSLKNLDAAVSEFKRGINSAQDNSRQELLFARYYLASCYERQRHMDKAIEQWEKIYAARASFKDVGEKLSQYQELRHDDTLKDFLTASMNDFRQLCSGVVKNLGLNIQEIQDSDGGCQVLAVDGEQKWRGAKRLPRLIRFYRVGEVIAEPEVRSFHETMKGLGIAHGMMFTTSNFSRKAVDFAANRSIDLYEKDKLQNLLKSVTS